MSDTGLRLNTNDVRVLIIGLDKIRLAFKRLKEPDLSTGGTYSEEWCNVNVARASVEIALAYTEEALAVLQGKVGFCDIQCYYPQPIDKDT
jgi:hypothetical protein